MTFAPVTSVAMDNADPAHLGAAASRSRAGSQLGGSVGLSVLGGIFSVTSAQQGMTGAIHLTLLVAATFPAAAPVIFGLWARPIAPNSLPVLKGRNQ